ncbi:MAG: cation:proton antiporter [Synechococcus sp.]
MSRQRSKAVVTNPNVPGRIREDLNLESGLNDGICVPILFGLLAFATHQASGGSSTQLLVSLFFKQIGFGVLVGAVFAVIGTLLVKSCSNRSWLSDTWQRMAIAALALACFSTSQALGGSGFIASFIGGLLFGGLAKNYKEDLLKASEANGDTLSLITWVAFGSAVVGSMVGQLTGQVVLYAILSLTVVRILPVFLCLSGLALDAWTKLFVGWFGPMGLASIVFAVIVLDENLSGGHTLTATVSCTIILSILVHGLTANPWARLDGQQMQKRAG